MDKSTIRGMKLLDLADHASSDVEEAIREFRICVEGYDNSLRGDELQSALVRHFFSCGTFAIIVSPINFGCGYFNRSFITMVGDEDNKKKALELNGSDMGGCKVVVTRFPYPQPIPELANRVKRPPTPDVKESRWMVVTGYDTSLSKDDIKSALIKHFSSCGEITETVDLLSKIKLRVLIEGEDLLEKALKLTGCECDVKGCKIVAKEYMRPKRRITSYTIKVPYIPEAKRSKV